jgi:hypothetical protein
MRYAYVTIIMFTISLAAAGCFDEQQSSYSIRLEECLRNAGIERVNVSEPPASTFPKHAMWVGFYGDSNSHEDWGEILVYDTVAHAKHDSESEEELVGNMRIYPRFGSAESERSSAESCVEEALDAGEHPPRDRRNT